MSHMIEIIDGKAQMAYCGEVPWHSLGKKVSNDLTPAQMLEEAGLDWTVEKIPAYYFVDGEKSALGREALIRSTDKKLLDCVTTDWNPVQNDEAFEFFNEYVMAGDMEMHTAGSLHGGQIVWGLAKVKQSFELFKGDQIDSYLLFSNFHKYGFSTDVRFTPIRVVCNNTLTLSLAGKSERMVKVSHRQKFDSQEVKETLGIATEKLAKYKELAKFLGSKKAKNEDVVEYFKRVFPILSRNAEQKNELSRNAKIALDIVETQPGAEFAKGTWWQPLNAVTFMVDHVVGHNDNNRIQSSWYGQGRKVKTKAIELATEYAEAA